MCQDDDKKESHILFFSTFKIGMTLIIFMKLRQYLVGGLACLLVFLAQPLPAQQNGAILPPPLKRNKETKTPSVAPDTVDSVAPSDQMTEPRMTVFDDWVHRCTDITLDGKSITQCELLQAQQKSQGEEMLNILILAFADIKIEDEGAKGEFMLTSVVPLDVFLPEGLRFLVDDRALFQVPFRNCNPNGCWSQIMVEKSALEALKKGKDGVARFTIMTGQEYEVKFSLNGLTAGLDALKRGSN